MLHTRAQLNSHAANPKSPYLVCKDETHTFAKCPIFEAKTMDQKKAFIHQCYLCFSCFRKGNKIKDVRRKLVCHICNKSHPTCMHVERIKEAVPRSNSEVTTESEKKEFHRVMSHTLTRCSSATPSIVNVFCVSSIRARKRNPHICLTKSDSSFILGDLIYELNVNTQPVQLLVIVTVILL